MIVGICGLIGSGKGTVADILEKEQDFAKISFADSLKDTVSAVFGWPRHLLEGDTAESRAWREEIDTWWADRLNNPNLTPRWVLQYWGTEVLRRGFHDDIWVASIQNKLRNTNRSYVIPDTRFPNEIDMIRKAGGQIWWVRRGDPPLWFTDYQDGDDRLLSRNDIHPSEFMWARSRFDIIIDNDSTLEHLRQSVEESISYLNIASPKVSHASR